MVEEDYEGKVVVIYNMIDMRALTCDLEIGIWIEIVCNLTKRRFSFLTHSDSILKNP